MSEVQLVLTERAQKNLTAMKDRVAQVGEESGKSSDVYVNMLESLTAALLGILRLGGRISAEDDLSLLGDSFITYGVIFFPLRHGDERDPLIGEWSIHS